MSLTLLATITLVLSPAMALAPPAAATIRTDSTEDRDAGWRSDLNFLLREAQRMHADPERPAFSARFETAAQELHEAIPQLSNDQVLAGMMRLLAILNDGHTAVYGAGRDSTLEIRVD